MLNFVRDFLIYEIQLQLAKLYCWCFKFQKRAATEVDDLVASPAPRDGTLSDDAFGSPTDATDAKLRQSLLGACE